MNGDRIREIAVETVREMKGRTVSNRVAIGADHGGFHMKEQLRRYMSEELGVHVVDCGTWSTDSVDYPDIAAKVAGSVSRNECDLGILIDGAGIGSSMAANKIAGVRAAVCHNDATTLNSREHNNSNVLCLGSNIVGIGNARRLVRLWLSTPFAGGRHATRVDKINALDESRGDGAE